MLTQLSLIGLADLLQNLAYAVQVSDLPAHLRDLIGMEGNLTSFSAGIIHIQDPLVMAFAAGARGAGNTRGVKRVTFEQGTAQQIIKRREFADQFASRTCWLRCCFLRHLYRCYRNS